MISCTGSPASRHRPSSSRVQPAEESSEAASGTAGGRGARVAVLRGGEREGVGRQCVGGGGGAYGVAVDEARRAPAGRGCRRAGHRRCGSASSVTTGWGAVWIRGGGCEPAERGAEGLVGVGQRDVDVADTEAVHQRGTAEPAQHELVEHRRGVPVLVVAGEQDLAAGPVHGHDAERAAGRGQAVGQRAGPRAGRVLEQVRREQVREQRLPGRVGLGEHDVDGLACGARADVGDQPVAGGVHDTRLVPHPLPQVDEVLGRDRGVAGPGRLEVQLVGDRERILRGHLGAGGDGLVQLQVTVRRPAGTPRAARGPPAPSSPVTGGRAGAG